MKSSVLYFCLLIAVIIFAVKVFFVSPAEHRDDGHVQSADQISLIYHQAQMSFKTRPTKKR